MDKQTFDRQAELEAMAEEHILEKLAQLLDLSIRAKLTTTISYLAVCHTLVKVRQEERVKERH